MLEIDPIVYEESSKTFMEILKVNNKEVPFANALAFFFRPNERHGLGTLFIDSLLATRCNELKKTGQSGAEDFLISKGYGCSDFHLPTTFNKDSVRVLVEQKVGPDKRIDLLVIADEFVICIEFKIDHDLDNPLVEYMKYVTDTYKDRRHYFVVLTPYRKEAIGAAKDFIATNEEFKLVILRHFVQTVKEKLNSSSDADKESRYYDYFLDLVQTVENRSIRHIRSKTLVELNQRINKSGIVCTFHGRNGGFLEVKNNSAAIKVRVKPSGWQLERWLGKERSEVVAIEDKNIDYEGLVERVKSYFVTTFDKRPIKTHC